jgi:hypothetical protein
MTDESVGVARTSEFFMYSSTPRENAAPLAAPPSSTDVEGKSLLGALHRRVLATEPAMFCSLLRLPKLTSAGALAGEQG